LNINTETYKIHDDGFLHLKTEKKQIVLLSTKTSLPKFIERINTLKHPSPCFSVDRKGKIHQHFHSDYYSNLIDNSKNKIIIALENYGWLSFDFNENCHKNWNNDIVINQKEIFEKEWRNYRYWHKYTTQQIKETAQLCNILTEKHNIKSETIGNNSFEKKAEIFNGIVSYSNLIPYETEINPSFDFKTFTKNLKL
jgi:hypothetical protein